MSANGYRDYYKVLGLERGADAGAIKRSFRKLARQHHPDVNPGDAAALRQSRRGSVLRASRSCSSS